MQVRSRTQLVAAWVGAVAFGAGAAQAAIVSSGGGLRLVEQSGTFDAANLSAGATAFANGIENPDANPAVASQPTAYGGFHTTTGVNNLVYGNPGAWLTGAPNTYVGVALSGPSVVSSIAYGRDNAGQFGDRSTGTLNIQYTTEANPVSASSWTSIGTTTYNTAPASNPNASNNAVRHRFNFTPVAGVTGIRLVSDTPGRGIDELELYSTAFPFAPPPAATPLAVGASVIQEETTNAVGISFQGAPIPAEPSPGDGQYRYVASPGNFFWKPNLTGVNVTASASWGVSFNHSLDVDYFFDPDGSEGPLPEIALTQDLRQDRLADQTTTPAGVEWSGFKEIANGLTLTAESEFRASGSLVAGGFDPQALSSAVWRFESVAPVPEPTSLALLGLAAVAGLRRRRV